jgi:hypothetical protein
MQKRSVLTKKIKLYRLLPSILLVLTLNANAQEAEYNAGNSWVHATAQKLVGMNFINSSTGTFMNNGTVLFSGNFQNDGTVGNDNTLTLGACLNYFQGTSAQTLSGSGNTSFYNLKLAGTAFSLQQPVTVVNQLDLSNGVVTAQQTTLQTVMNQVQLVAGSSCVNVADASFIDGFVQKTGHSAFTFPIGNDGYYRPVSISAPTLATDAFTARYIHADPAAGGYSRTAKVSGVGSVSNTEYWILQRTSGSSSPQVTLTWNSSTSVTIPSDLTLLQVVRWDGSQWVNEGNVSTTGNSTAGSVTASVTGYGVLSFAVKDATPKQLTMKVYLQGVWNGTSMNKFKKWDDVLVKAVDAFSGTVVDTLSVEFHDPDSYSTILYQANGLELNTDGSINTPGKSYIEIPSDYSGNYRLTVKHRNHIETTSALPVSFAGATIDYDFTDASAKAFQSDASFTATKQINDKWMMYAGDVFSTLSNPEINSDDLFYIFNHNSALLGTYGYSTADVNGDGIADEDDLYMSFANQYIILYIP